MLVARNLLAALSLVALAGPANAAIIAYNVPAGTVGNQVFGEGLGMDFNVGAQPIRISSLGVFDSGSNGLSATLTAALFNRVTGTLVPGSLLTFAPGNTGTLIGGSRFLDLPTPIDLPAGFQGSIVAYGYSATEPNGNQGSGSLGLTTNSGGGLISFVGGGRFGGAPGTFPPNGDGGPANRYAAGTFQFDVVPQVTAVPEPMTLAVFGLMAVGAGVGVRRRKVAA